MWRTDYWRRTSVRSKKCLSLKQTLPVKRLYLSYFTKYDLTVHNCALSECHLKLNLKKKSVYLMITYLYKAIIVSDVEKLIFNFNIYNKFTRFLVLIVKGGTERGIDRRRSGRNDKIYLSDRFLYPMNENKEY